MHLNYITLHTHHPPEHWLPGMKIGNDYLRGIEWHLSSWESSQQPVVGSVVKFRGGPWRNQRFKGVSSFSRNLNFKYNVIINENEVSLSYSYEKSSTLDRITLSSSWKLESWGWIEGAKDWQLGVFFPKDLCDTYNICSAYGSCIINMIDQSCACMDETRFVPRNKKRWEMGDWSDGCVRRTPLDCKTGTEKFIKYSNVKLLDIHDSWFNKSMNMQECEAQCLENCTCMAYAEADTSLGGRGCMLWFGELIDIRVYPEGKGGRDIFVRLASSELGNGSYLPILQ
ncbi:putative non-specific serine/threonine protein kinase [Helianthus anomalus]